MRPIAIAIGVFAGGLVCVAQSSPITGQWNLGGPIVQDRVQLTIRRSAGLNSNMNSSSPIALNQLRGLTRAQLDSTGTVAQFELLRDAGYGRYIRMAR